MKRYYITHQFEIFLNDYLFPACFCTFSKIGLLNVSSPHVLLCVDGHKHEINHSINLVKTTIAVLLIKLQKDYMDRKFMCLSTSHVRHLAS